MGIGIEVWIDQIRDFRFAAMELDAIRLFRTTDRARRTSFIKPQKRIEALDRIDSAGRTSRSDWATVIRNFGLLVLACGRS